jgi:hypothetical protein
VLEWGGSIGQLDILTEKTSYMISVIQNLPPIGCQSWLVELVDVVLVVGICPMVNWSCVVSAIA